MDISWQTLGRIVRAWAGESAQISEVKPLDGGYISSTVALTLVDGQQAVCKISAHRVDRSYVNEAHQLAVMAAAGVPVPKVFAAKTGSLDDPNSYILMEFIDGIPLSTAQRQCSTDEFDEIQADLARVMHRLHSNTSENFGRVQVEPEPEKFANWPELFRSVYDSMCDQVLQDKNVPLRCRKHLGKIHEKLDGLIHSDEKPQLMHWDAWSSNILVRPDASGKWKVVALLDPNCKFARAEIDLAYMSLFHTSTPAFMKAYQHDRRLDDGYHTVRKPVYQIYSLVDHVQLFGAEYVKPLSAALENFQG